MSSPRDGSLNYKGAKINESKDTSLLQGLRSGDKGRPIDLPNQRRPVKHFSLDIGGSLAKLVYFESNSSKNREVDSDDDEDIIGGKLHFLKFETSGMSDCLDFILANQLHIDGARRKTVNVTGGGAYKYGDLIEKTLQITLHKEDEMLCLIDGLNFLLQHVSNESFTYSPLPGDPNPKTYVPSGDNPFPYLLVNIGSGVSIVRVDSEKSFQRIDGTSLGGGTFYGLCNLLTGLGDFDQMLELSTKGDSNLVDLIVGDIYGTDYSKVGLKSDVIASSFGKLLYRDKNKDNFSQADIAMSLIKMLCNNIGQISYLNAIRSGVTRIYYGGFFLRDHPISMQRISFAVDFWSKGTIQALFLRHEGYLGALGAFLHLHTALAPSPVPFTSPASVDTSKEWLQKRSSDIQKIVTGYAPLSFDFDLNLQPKMDDETESLCQCGTEFCDGVACKNQTTEKR